MSTPKSFFHQLDVPRAIATLPRDYCDPSLAVSRLEALGRAHTNEIETVAQHLAGGVV
ncbi:hypothetical protein GCM10009693_06660 [Leucobacter chromiireducens subsp. chromiireducens]